MTLSFTESEASLSLYFTENAETLFSLFCLYSWELCRKAGAYEPHRLLQYGFSQSCLVFRNCLYSQDVINKLFWVKRIKKMP